MWILLVLIYGALKGVRDISKKLALKRNNVTEVLFAYTLISFVLVTPEVTRCLGVPWHIMLAVAFKSFIIFIAFLCSFHAIKKMPVSLYGVLDLSRMLFAMILGVTVLKERLKPGQIVGFILVCTGLLLLKLKTADKKETDKDKDSQKEEIKNGIFLGGEKIAVAVVIMAFVSTLLNAVSGILDKVLMGTNEITSGQLQFWYTLFMVIYYGIYSCATKTKITKSVWKNPYVWLIAVLFVIADRCLFIANGMPGARVTVMTLLKQVCCVVTIIGGRIVFKEKHIAYRLMCAGIVIAGIVAATF